VVGGSRFVADLLGRHNEHQYVLWTCAPAPASPPPTAPEKRGPIVAWAHERPLLFPLEASLMQRVMIEVFRRTRCTFWLFGSEPSEAQAWLEPLRAAGGHCVAIPLLPYEKYLSKVAQAAVGLQPVCTQNEFSRGRSFGKILAYLSGQVAVVASDAVEHPKFFRQAENGFLATDAVEDWVEPIVHLCEDQVLRRSVALAGWHVFQERLTTEVFARLLDPILQASIATAAAKPGPSF
jgi:glycosyltransferase involved in cell wall biosynthesis